MSENSSESKPKIKIREVGHEHTHPILTVEQDELKIGVWTIKAKKEADPVIDMPDEYWESMTTARHEQFSRGEVTFVGVVVEVGIVVEYKTKIDRFLVLGEESLWGIESDSSEEYFQQVAEELTKAAVEEAEGAALALIKQIMEGR